MKERDTWFKGFPWQPAARLAGATCGAGNGQWLLSAQEDDVVTVHRRRPTEPTAPQDREQAETPHRRQDDGGLPPSSSGGGGSGGGNPFSGGGLPGGGKIPGGCVGLLIVIVLALVAIFGGPNLLNQGSPGNQNSTNNQPAAQEPAIEPTATEIGVEPTQPAAGQSGVQPTQPAASQAATSSGATKGQSWTVMLYQDADDKVLAKDIYVDLNEAERAGSTDKVHIVAQIDRYRGDTQGTDNWVGAKRFLVTKDDDLNHIHSKQLADLGDINMSDGKTLIDFVTWTMKNYPADKYVLILSDHGMGWPGGWSDASSNNKSASDPSIPLENSIGNILYLKDLDKALGDIRSQTGLDKFEVIGLDACLMAQLEVFNALQPHAHYAVASEETEPSLGWAYTSFLSTLTANPDIDGATLSKSIVQSYIDGDQRIVDDRARAELSGRGSTIGGKRT